MQATQMLMQAHALSSGGVATISGGRERTWGEIAQRVPRMAGAFQSLGLQRGDLVAVLSMNSDTYLELFFAVPWAGGALAPLNIRWSVAENEYAIGNSRARILFVDENYVAQALELKQRCETIEHLVFMGQGDPPGGMLALESLLDAAAPVPNACMKDDELYVIFYTGGTTGRPKGVALSHRAIVYSSVCYLAMLPSIESLRFLYVGGFFHFWGRVLSGTSRSRAARTSSCRNSKPSP